MHVHDFNCSYVCLAVGQYYLEGGQKVWVLSTNDELYSPIAMSKILYGQVLTATPYMVVAGPMQTLWLA